ncbi:polysaccharide deacetylase family protein [Pararoseomonas indoligenes]|uniref:Chitooligosaccharide deacetylase n=1 Tax=Roseomonas indoligenes TaxID=2820811 RepID=A0A940N3H7_9PROT|nr:polysaccharide deacetylase family protein [Pararoseomonas indoligenes]MBP0495909.1 polysaccharide deacetylase family protein [Pararoseomonas indoligenes]
MLAVTSDQARAWRAARPGRPPWLGGARCVVAITIDFDGASNELGKKIYPAGSHSHGLYSARRGVPRYLRLLERAGIPATFFVPGRDAELFPESVLSLRDAGHEIAAHGYLHEGWELGPEEPELLARSHKILTDLLGTEPRGWRSPSGRKTGRTTRLLRDMGYRYDASEKDFDLPYFPVLDGEEARDIVVLPNNTSSLDDFPFYRVSWRPPSEVLQHWKEEFAAIYAESGYFILTIHPRAGFGSGTPARAAMVESLIHHIQGHEGVRFVRLGELADHCLTHPEAFSHG